MFGYIKKCFFAGLAFLLTLTSINLLSCISMNNQECRVRPQIVKGGHKQKVRWKGKQANSLLNKNPCLASKRVLDPRCYVKLSADKGTMDQHKSSAVFDPFNSVPLPPLDGLPAALPQFFFFSFDRLVLLSDGISVQKICFTVFSNNLSFTSSVSAFFYRLNLQDLDILIYLF